MYCLTRRIIPQIEVKNKKTTTMVRCAFCCMCVVVARKPLKSRRHSRVGGNPDAARLRSIKSNMLNFRRCLALFRFIWPADAGLWIPAYAGMTIGGEGSRCEEAQKSRTLWKTSGFFDWCALRRVSGRAGWPRLLNASTLRRARGLLALDRPNDGSRQGGLRLPCGQQPKSRAPFASCDRAP